MTIPTLAEIDLTTPRTQPELRAYVDEQHRQFGETEDGRNILRLGDAQVKRFREELWSLSLYADAFYKNRTDVWFYLMPENTDHDAEVKEGSRIGFLEITQALTRAGAGVFDGHQNRLRMEHMKKFRRAPGTCPEIRRDGNAILETWPEALAHKDLLAGCFGAIEQVVARKGKKHYPLGTSLIVEFKDDFIRSKADQDALDSFASAKLATLAAKFVNLYLVSDRQRLGFKYQPNISA